MAFAVRCPECRAKLKLDSEPDADEVIECPKCGTQFEATAARVGEAAEPRAKAKAKGGEDKPVKLKEKKSTAGGTKTKKEKAPKPPPVPGAPKKRRAKKRKSNKTILIGMSLGAVFILTGIGIISYILLSRSGKMEQMLACVPAECNLVRGVNCGHVYKYAGYKSEADKAMAGPLKDCWEAISIGLSLGQDEATPEYAILAKNKAGSVGSMIVYRTRNPLPDPNAVGPALGGADQPVAGQAAYKIAGRGALGGAVVYVPTNRLIVVVLPGPQQNDLLQKSVAGRLQPETSFYGKMGATGRKVSSGSLWVLVRSDGDLKNYTGNLLKPVAQDFGPLAEQAKKTPIFGLWTSFGTKITFGAALQCDSPEVASTLLKTMREGPMGKQEDQPEFPNSLKSAVTTIRAKEMSEFFSNLYFYSKGDCGYFQTQMNSKDKALMALRMFNNPDLTDAPPGFGP